MFLLDSSNHQALFYASVASVCVASFFNVSMVLYLIISELRSSLQVEKYLVEYNWLAAVVSIMSLSNFEVMAVLNSGLLDKKMFKIGWSSRTDIKVKSFGLFGHIIEDVPQLVIQVGTFLLLLFFSFSIQRLTRMLLLF